MEAAKETVNNLISAASTMVYGDASENKTETTTTGKKDSLLGDESTASTTAKTANTTGGIEPVSGESGPGTATGESSNITDPTSSTSKSSATATTAQDVGSAPPESGATPTAKQQGADKPTTSPDATESEAISTKKDAAEEAMGESGGNTSGSSGPTDTATGADAGSSGPISDTPGPKPLGSDSNKSPSGGPDDALGSKSEEKGTGEKYIKSTGMQADGGDFDAANAGAGREADRLLEEKGVHREGGNTGPPQEIPGNSKGASGSDEKVSFSQKLKDKLHIKSKDKP